MKCLHSPGLFEVNDVSFLFSLISPGLSRKSLQTYLIPDATGYFHYKNTILEAKEMAQ